MKEKQEENIEKVGIDSPLHHTCQMCDHHARGHPNCLAVYVMKKLQEVKLGMSLHHTCQACDHHARGYPNCLAVYVVKGCTGMTSSSVGGT